PSRFLDQPLLFRIEQVADEEINLEVWTAFPEPGAGQLGLEFASIGGRKQMAFDVVRLVDVGLDEGDAADARVAAEQVEHRHSALEKGKKLLVEFLVQKPEGVTLGHVSCLSSIGSPAAPCMPTLAVVRLAARRVTTRLLACCFCGILGNVFCWTRAGKDALAL